MQKDKVRDMIGPPNELHIAKIELVPFEVHRVTLEKGHFREFDCICGERVKLKQFWFLTFSSNDDIMGDLYRRACCIECISKYIIELTAFYESPWDWESQAEMARKQIDIDGGARLNSLTRMQNRILVLPDAKEKFMEANRRITNEEAAD